MKILLTGSTGFIGTQLVPALSLRHEVSTLDARRVLINNSQWQSQVDDCDVLINLAGRAHVTTNNSNDQRELYRVANTELVKVLAERLAEKPAKRFVFISTAKVLGEVSQPNSPLAPGDPYFSKDAYSHSKIEAEKLLIKLASQSSLEYTIIRPPLVYGPGVKANFLTMIKWVNNERVLPLGNINNKRSFLGIRNLVSLIETCATNEHAKNQIFHVSDDHDISTTELLVEIAASLNKRTRLVAVPNILLKFSSQLVGRPRVYDQLCKSLQLDISFTTNCLSWTPPFSIAQELEQTARWFKDSQ